MRILIIGGTSFIGPHVVKHLEGMGHHVAVFHRGQTSRELSKTVRHLFGDRNHLGKYTDDFLQFSPEVVIDMIPSTEADAKQLIEVFKPMRPRIVAISSQDVYRAYGLVRRIESGQLEPLPITEESKLRNQLYPYQDASKDKEDWSNTYDKLLVEKVIMESDLEASILRLPAVYGQRDNQHRFFSYLNLKRMKDNRPFIIMDEQFAQWRWTHAYVENAAWAIAVAAVDKRSIGRIFNVGEIETPTMYEFIKEISEYLKWEGKLILLPKKDLPESLQFPLDTAQQLIVDSTRIREELGFREIITREEGLTRTIQWELDHIPIDTDPRHQKITYEEEDGILRKLGILGVS